jgi:chemotaxis protein CheX
MADGDKRNVVVLPQVMDLRAAGPLAQRILGFQGRPLILDASDVERIGGLCLQVLLSARLSWAVDRVPLTVMNPTRTFEESLELFGAPRFAISKTS